MQDNNLYNLMEQYVQEHKSLWRISNPYITDAEGKADVVEFWQRMQKDKEDHLKELSALIKKYHD